MLLGAYLRPTTQKVLKSFSFLFMPLPSMEMKTSENKLFEDGEATDADNTLPLDVNCFEEISSLHRKWAFEIAHPLR